MRIKVFANNVPDTDSSVKYDWKVLVEQISICRMSDDDREMFICSCRTGET